MNVDLQFIPREYVTVTLHGLNYPGRVQQCVVRHGWTIVYDVEYIVNGELKRGEFFGDELTYAPVARPSE